MKPINCLIVDDEEPARKLVENYIQRVPHLRVAGLCANPLEAMQLLRAEPVDILFLDIQMPELTGVEFLKTLSQPPLVIFTTAYKEYALEGYELEVVDYLLKPFRFERFLQAVNRATKRLPSVSSPTPPATATPPEPPAAAKDHLLVKSDFKVFRLFFADIRYIESMKEYVAFHTADGRTLSLGSLKQLTQDLPPEQFIRIHKSYIANIRYITALEGNMIHIGAQKLPLGPSYREAVLRKVFH